MRTAVGFVLAIGIACALVTPARATPATAGHDARARAYFANGRALGERGRYGEALAEFSAGYELSRRPQFLFNMAECARALGDATRARLHYEAYLREVSSGPLRAVAQRRLAALPPAPPAAVPEAARDSAVLTPTRVAAGAGVGPTRVELVSLPPTRPARRGGSVWKNPWLWAGAGALLAAGGVVLYTTTRSDEDPACGTGCIDLR